MPSDKITFEDVIKKLLSFSPVEFEDFVGRCFKKQGYEYELTPKSNDLGVDLFLKKDGKVIIVQCKRFEGTVPTSCVRELIGAKVVHNADHAILVTTGSFTKSGYETAEKGNVELIDGKRLIRLINGGWIDKSIIEAEIQSKFIDEDPYMAKLRQAVESISSRYYFNENDFDDDYWLERPPTQKELKKAFESINEDQKTTAS